MLGVRIFIHSLKQVFGNLWPTIRIVAPILVVQFIAGWVLGYVLRANGMSLEFMIFFGKVPVWLIIVLFLFTVIPMVWTAVNWHRFILLSEQPRGILPPFRWKSQLAYFGYLVLLLLIAALLVLAITFLFSFFLTAVTRAFGLSELSPLAETVLTLVFALILYVPFSVLLLRLSPVLPAAAIGKRMKIAEAWAKTEEAGGPVLVVALLAYLGVTVLDIAWAHMPVTPGMAFMGQMMLNYVYSLVSLSILTTIYGHFVEGRELRA